MSPFRSTLPWLVLAATTAIACLPDEPRFGPPNNLRERGVGSGGSGGRLCALPPGVDETGNTCPIWACSPHGEPCDGAGGGAGGPSEYLFERIFDNPNSAGCTNDGCHAGIHGAKGLTLFQGDAADSYAAMASYLNADGHPYIRPGGVDDAYLMCNVWKGAPHPIGSLMPLVQGNIELIEDDDLIDVGNWVACGMPETYANDGGLGGAGGQGGN